MSRIAVNISRIAVKAELSLRQITPSANVSEVAVKAVKAAHFIRKCKRSCWEKKKCDVHDLLEARCHYPTFLQGRRDQTTAKATNIY